MNSSMELGIPITAQAKINQFIFHNEKCRDEKFHHGTNST